MRLEFRFVIERKFAIIIVRPACGVRVGKCFEVTICRSNLDKPTIIVSPINGQALAESLVFLLRIIIPVSRRDECAVERFFCHTFRRRTQGEQTVRAGNQASKKSHALTILYQITSMPDSAQLRIITQHKLWHTTKIYNHVTTSISARM